MIKYYCFNEVEKSNLNGKVEIKKNHKFLNELIQEKITYFKDESTNKETPTLKEPPSGRTDVQPPEDMNL